VDDTHPRRVAHSPRGSKDIHRSRAKVIVQQRAANDGRSGCVVWLTGLPASGKSTVSRALQRELFSLGKSACVLDGDNIRRGLNSDLGFSRNDRKENVRRIGEVAKLFADAGIICITALISPYRVDRDRVRRMFSDGKFIEVFVNAPIKVCERRDPKGLYARARAGEIKEFTGVSAPYEPPVMPEIELRTDRLSVTESVEKLIKFLHLRGGKSAVGGGRNSR